MKEGHYTFNKEALSIYLYFYARGSLPLIRLIRSGVIKAAQGLIILYNTKLMKAMAPLCYRNVLN